MNGHTNTICPEYNNSTDGHTVVKVRDKLGTCHTRAALGVGMTKTGDGPRKNPVKIQHDIRHCITIHTM